MNHRLNMVWRPKSRGGSIISRFSGTTAVGHSDSGFRRAVTELDRLEDGRENQYFWSYFANLGHKNKGQYSIEMK